MQETPQSVAAWMVRQMARGHASDGWPRIMARKKALWFATVPTMRGAAFWLEVAAVLRHSTAQEKAQMQAYYQKHSRKLKARSLRRYHRIASAAPSDREET